MHEDCAPPALADAWIVRLLREARARSGLSRLQLAERLKVPEAQLAALERGEATACSALALRRIAVALSVSFADG